MIKRSILLLFMLTICMVSCKKKEQEEKKFTVRVSQSSGSCTLSWDPLMLSDFKNVSIYRSMSAIPDPAFDKPIDANLLLASISDKTITSFVDSNLVINSSGTVFYKLVVNFGGRFIVSDLLQVNLNGYSMVLGVSNFGNSFSIVKFPQLHRFYYIDFNNTSLKVINYLNGQVGSTVSFNTSNNNFPLMPVMNGANPEVFSCNGTQIACYDAITLAVKYTISVGSSIMGFCVKNNYLYVSTYYQTLITYDLATKNVISQIYLNSSVNAYSLKPFAGKNNALYLRYYESYYNSSTNQNYYVNRVKIYKIAAGVPVDSTFVNNAILNPDSSLSSNVYNTIDVSPDGKYLTCGFTGSVYSFIDNTTHDIHTSHNFSPVPSFSFDGQYLVTKPSNTFGTYTVDIFAPPGFTFQKSLKSPNNILNSGSAWDDFPTHDTLVSYNVKQVLQGNQLAATLTIFFNKVN